MKCCTFLCFEAIIKLTGYRVPFVLSDNDHATAVGIRRIVTASSQEKRWKAPVLHVADIPVSEKCNDLKEET